MAIRFLFSCLLGLTLSVFTECKVYGSEQTIGPSTRRTCSQLSLGGEKFDGYIGKSLDIFRGESHGLSPVEVLLTQNWHKSEDIVPTFGYSNIETWACLEVVNRTSRSEWLLEYAYPLMQEVEIYGLIRNEVVWSFKTGKLQPFVQRPLPHRNFVFPMNLPPEIPVTVLMKFKTRGAMHLPLRFLRTETFISNVSRELLFFGIYFGGALILIAYNFAVFLALREKSLLWYISYVAALSLCQTTLYGIAYQFIWPNWVQLNKISLVLVAAIAFFLLTGFARSFFGIQRKPVLDRVICGLASCSALVLAIGAIFFYGATTIRMTGLIAFFVPACVLFVSIRSWRQKKAGAMFFTLGVGCYLVGGMLYGLRDLGVFKEFRFIEFAPLLGGLAEMYVLAAGLAQRIKNLRHEREFANLRRQIAESDLKLSQIKISQQTELVNLARKVSHDIRSPVAALEVVVGSSSKMGAQERSLVRTASKRIRDIASELLTHGYDSQEEFNKSNTFFNSQNSPSTGSCGKMKIGTYSVVSCVEQIVNEKKIEYGDRPCVSISHDTNPFRWNLFANFNPSALMQLLSNIINNSVEALGVEGKVVVTVQKNLGCCQMVVSDNGKGIPASLLKKVGEKGFSYGKADAGMGGGSGIGLYNARKVLSEWGGNLQIISTEGVGTCVIVELPIANPPEVFANELLVDRNSDIIVLDDEELIHQLWSKRFENFSSVKGYGYDLVHCHSEEEFRKFSNTVEGSNPLWLIDFELGKTQKTGLDLVSELNIISNVVLVTGSWDDDKIISKCRELGVKILPKTLAAHVNISEIRSIYE